MVKRGPKYFSPIPFIRENTIYSVWLRTNLRRHNKHEFEKFFRWQRNAMFNKNGKTILLQTVILIQTRFIDGIILVV